MAVGDVVIDVLGASSWQYFQPAASVEVMIMAVFLGDNDSKAGIGTSGTNGYSMFLGSSYGPRNTANVKIPINNTDYLCLYSTTVNAAYSGIQIK
tara:strand:- start:247 stop:531 length:285 start_codon:yes stop_codon:yes gene_type:complete